MDHNRPKEEALPAEDLHDLENEELSGSSSTEDDASITETDEDEGEGLGMVI